MKTAVVIIAALLALGSGILVREFLLSTDNSRKMPLPVFSWPDLSGKEHNISEWQGKILVINFWASWCSPCRKEIPEFVALQEQYSRQGLQFIGIAIDDKDAVEEYLKQAKVNYPMLIAGDKGIALALQLGNNVNAVPYTVVVDQHGQIIHQHPGGFSTEQILELITPLIKEQKSN